MKYLFKVQEADEMKRYTSSKKTDRVKYKRESYLFFKIVADYWSVWKCGNKYIAAESPNPGTGGDFWWEYVSNGETYRYKTCPGDRWYDVTSWAPDFDFQTTTPGIENRLPAASGFDDFDNLVVAYTSDAYIEPSVSLTVSDGTVNYNRRKTYVDITYTDDKHISAITVDGKSLDISNIYNYSGYAHWNDFELPDFKYLVANGVEPLYAPEDTTKRANMYDNVAWYDWIFEHNNVSGGAADTTNFEELSEKALDGTLVLPTRAEYEAAPERAHSRNEWIDWSEPVNNYSNYAYMICGGKVWPVEYEAYNETSADLRIFAFDAHLDIQTSICIEHETDTHVPRRIISIGRFPENPESWAYCSEVYHDAFNMLSDPGHYIFDDLVEDGMFSNAISFVVREPETGKYYLLAGPNQLYDFLRHLSDISQLES